MQRKKNYKDMLHDSWKIKPQYVSLEKVEKLIKS